MKILSTFDDLTTVAPKHFKVVFVFNIQFWN